MKVGVGRFREGSVWEVANALESFEFYIYDLLWNVAELGDIREARGGSHVV